VGWVSRNVSVIQSRRTRQIYRQLLLSVSDFFLYFKSLDSCARSLPVTILTILFSVVLCRMKMYEMKRDGRYGIGFIDPNTVNEKIWSRYQKDIERSLLQFFKRLNTQPEILLPYNFGWVLLSYTTNFVFA
jgi:hypothetical protein